MNIFRKFIVIYFTITIQVIITVSAQNISPADQKLETERTDAYAAQLENYLRQYLVDEYDIRASSVWHRDYSSIDAFERSVAPNRERWASVGMFIKKWLMP